MFTISTEQINQVISNMTGMIEDLMPLVMFLMGIFVAFMIVDGIFGVEDDEEEETKKRLRKIKRGYYGQSDDYIDY